MNNNKKFNLNIIMPFLTEDMKYDMKYAPRIRIFSVIVSREKHLEIVDEIIKEFIGEDLKLVFVSVNGYGEKFESMKLNKNVYFLDCTVVADSVRKERYLAIHPANLTGLGISIKEIMLGILGQKLLFFNTFSSISRFNDKKTTTNFLMFLMKLLKEYSIRSIIIFIKEDLTDEWMKILKKFCDKIIEV